MISLIWQQSVKLILFFSSWVVVYCKLSFVRKTDFSMSVPLLGLGPVLGPDIWPLCIGIWVCMHQSCKLPGHGEWPPWRQDGSAYWINKQMGYHESRLTIPLAGSHFRPASHTHAPPSSSLPQATSTHSVAIFKNIFGAGLCLFWFGRHTVYLLRWKNIVIKPTNPWQLEKEFQSGNAHLWPFLIIKTRTN